MENRANWRQIEFQPSLRAVEHWIELPQQFLGSRGTYREDPLPERPRSNRNVTLPRVKWLERPDP